MVVSAAGVSALLPQPISSAQLITAIPINAMIFFFISLLVLYPYLFHSLCGMSNIEILDSLDLAQTCDLAVYAFELLFQESSSSPAMSLFAWSPATTISGRSTTLV